MRTLAITAACVVAAYMVACGDAQPSSAGAAITVDGHAIATSRYDAAVQSLRQRMEQHTGAAISTTTAAGRRALATVEAAAIRALVSAQVVDDIAAAHHVAVSDGDVDSALQALQGSAGSADALVVQLGSSGLSDADVHAAVRALLLQQRLRAADPHYDADLAAALRHASVRVDAAPCTTDHAYPACLAGA